MLCPRRKDSPKAVIKISGHPACFLEAQYGNPGNRPGFMKVVHELLGITKGTGYFQIEPGNPQFFQWRVVQEQVKNEA